MIRPARLCIAWLVLLGLIFLTTGCGSAPAAPVPTAAPTTAPTAIRLPAPVAPSQSPVPELRGITPADAASLLQGLGLSLGQPQSSCAAIGGTPLEQPVPVGSILCQAVAPASMAPLGLAIDYVVYEGDR